MDTAETTPTLSLLFSELTNGVKPSGGFILNTGDAGLLASLDKISAADASRSVNDGATIAAHAQLEPTLLESSAVLGAGRIYTFRRIVLPLIRPGIIAGAFIAFMSSFDNVPVSLFLRDAATDMLPIRMWQDLEGKLDVTIAALSGVLIITTVALVAIMERVTGLSRRLTN